MCSENFIEHISHSKDGIAKCVSTKIKKVVQCKKFRSEEKANQFQCF